MARFLLRLGRFIQSLAIMVMRPDDLVEFSRQDYAMPSEVRYWRSEAVVGAGLNSIETVLLNQIPIKTGQVLVLFGGGGRDALALAKSGFEVTVVDFVPEMLTHLQEVASQQELPIKGLVQEVSQLQVPEGYYDIVWLANSMYSSVPTQKRRIEMLRRIRRALKPGGYFFCSFRWEKRHSSAKVELGKKIFALLTLGNLWYEPGDILWRNAEFLHAFSSRAELASELVAGGFTMVYWQALESALEGGALLVTSG
jgi:ubiquinone/menaquinone biosynthesis C-methylase UbiE